MPWPTPQLSRNQVNRAGAILVSDSAPAEEIVRAHFVLGHWRACHGYPINTFQATLRTKLKRVDGDAIVAQRLKRTPSIISKLKRFDSMQLARMQDIGGLRAVVSSVARVRRLERDYENSHFEHELVSRKDYITKPKPDGYRSVHLVFRYKNKRAPAYNGLLLELQVRTKLQHAWATAVETMGTFLGQALKAREGEQRWLRFFEVVGSAFAHLEKSPLVPGYVDLDQRRTFSEVANAESQLRVLDKLGGFSVAVGAITTEKRPGSYHLVILDSQNKKVQIRPYAKAALEEATAAYTEAENRVKRGEPLEVVLVSAGPIESLRRAYPNYFLDTDDFIRKVRQVIREVERPEANTALLPMGAPRQSRSPRRSRGRTHK